MEEAKTALVHLVLRLLGVKIPTAAQLDALDAHLDAVLAAEAQA